MHDHNYLGLNIQRKKSFKKKRLKKIALDTGENTDDDEENESAGQVQATCDAPRRTNFDKFKLHTEDELFPPNPVSFVQRCFGSDVKEYYQLITDTKSYYDRLPQMPVTVSDTVLNSVTQKHEHGHFVLKASDEVNSKMELLRSKQKLGLNESFLTTELPRTSNFEEELQGCTLTMEDSLMNVEIFVNEDSLDRAEDSLANKLPNVNLHNSSISDDNVKLFEVLEKKDLSKAGDLFSLEDSVIVNELSKVLKTIEVGTL